MQALAVSALVVVMMLAIGLRTELGEFADVWRRPGALVASVLVNVVGAPLLAFAVTRYVPLPDAVVVGLLICAACPGGPTGPLFAATANGHLATAVTAMVSLAMLSVVTAPATLARLLGTAVDIDVARILAPMMTTLVLVQLLPLVTGLALRRWGPPRVQRLAGPATRAANLLLLLVIAGLLATKGGAVFQVGALGVAVSLGLVLANLGGGALAGPTGGVRRSLSLVTGVRSISLALLLSAGWFPDPLTDATILVFGLLTMVVPFAVARMLGRRGPPSEARAA